MSTETMENQSSEAGETTVIAPYGFSPERARAAAILLKTAAATGSVVKPKPRRLVS